MPLIAHRRCASPEPFLSSSRDQSEEGRRLEEGSRIGFLLQKLEEEEGRFGLGLFFRVGSRSARPVCSEGSLGSATVQGWVEVRFDLTCLISRVVFSTGPHREI